jgi:hypothetical protein
MRLSSFAATLAFMTKVRCVTGDEHRMIKGVRVEHSYARVNRNLWREDDKQGAASGRSKKGRR